MRKSSLIDSISQINLWRMQQRSVIRQCLSIDVELRYRDIRHFWSLKQRSGNACDDFKGSSVQHFDNEERGCGYGMPVTRVQGEPISARMSDENTESDKNSRAAHGNDEYKAPPRGVAQF